MSLDCSRNFQREKPMQVKLKIRKKGTLLEEGIYNIFDAESFDKACADLSAAR